LKWIDSALCVAHQALAIDPNCADACVTLGYLYRNDIFFGPDSLQVALASLEKAIELDPNNYEAFYRLGQLKWDVGISVSEALELLSHALELNPLADEVHDYLSWMYYKLGDSTRSVMHSEAAKKISPEKFHGRLGIIIDQEHYDEAIALIEEQLDKNPQNQWIKHDLAVVLKNAGQYSRSEQLFHEVIKYNPHNIWHYLGLANAYIEQDFFEEALAVFQAHQSFIDTSKNCSPDLMLDFNQSLLLSRMGQKEKAIKILTLALADPEMRLRAFGHSMQQIIDFYLGKISADSVEQAMVAAEHRLQRRIYLNNQYFYLALAYLYNISPGYTLTPVYIERALSHLKRYEQNAIKHDVEFSLARMELKRLQGLGRKRN
jgi:tetratricopeptide (TPR) repeat protein